MIKDTSGAESEAHLLFNCGRGSTIMKAVTVTAPLEKCQCYCTHCKFMGRKLHRLFFLFFWEVQAHLNQDIPASLSCQVLSSVFVVLDIKYLVNNQIPCSGTAVSLGKSKNYWTSPLSDSIFALWLQKAGLCSVHTAGPAPHVLS